MSRTVMSLLLAVVLAASVASSQTRAGASISEGSPHYDKATETTVKGTVETVTPDDKNRWAQIRLTLKSGAEIYDVHVGPAAYISSQRFSFANGDKIEVLGSKVKITDKNVLLARQITKDGKVLKLRDEQGFPVFAHKERQESHTEDE